ncbi:MAG: hypothetical protein PF545_02415 [Elusimicrobia bacterium]|jgi:tetratricopeptide (TPR) repeat protein|nr:hypothetical protein [Elusimicrobiota bacterium]
MKSNYFLKKTIRIGAVVAGIILALTFSLKAAKSNAPESYNRAMELYGRQEYKKALKLFERVTESNAPVKWRYLSKYYIAKGKVKTGKLEESVNILTELIYKPEIFKYIKPSVIVGNLADIKNSHSISNLKGILKKSKITEVRKSAAENLARLAHTNKENGIAEDISNYMFTILKTESETEVAKSVSEAITKIGRINADKLIDAYRAGNDFTKQKILLLISKQEDEDLVMALQNDIGSSSKTVKNYILWALCKIDPYRFGDMFKGKLTAVDGNYYIRSGGRRLTVIVLTGKDAGEDAGEDKKDKELSGFKDKYVVLYGKETEEGIIYADCFEDK